MDGWVAASNSHLNLDAQLWGKAAGFAAWFQGLSALAWPHAGLGFKSIILGRISWALQSMSPWCKRGNVMLAFTGVPE